MVFFFNDTATTEIYTLPLHDALPISLELDVPQRAPRAPVHHVDGALQLRPPGLDGQAAEHRRLAHLRQPEDRKSTRLNSSHANISYAVFCLKKKQKYENTRYHVSLHY